MCSYVVRAPKVLSTRFASPHGHAGLGSDNPDDPRSLTKLQFDRTLALWYKDVSGWTIHPSIGCCSSGGRRRAPKKGRRCSFGTVLPLLHAVCISHGPRH